jgi:hypothetical protein
MTEDGQPVTRHTAPTVSRPASQHPRKPTPLEQMGGMTGLVYMALPIVTFVLANSAFSLISAICTAVGVALAISVARLIRKEPIQPTLSGLFGVAVASFGAWKTGSAMGFFLTGIGSNIALAVLFLISVVVRRPLAGIVWGALNGTGTIWLRDKPSRRAYDSATLGRLLGPQRRLAMAVRRRPHRLAGRHEDRQATQRRTTAAAEGA